MRCDPAELYHEIVSRTKALVSFKSAKYGNVPVFLKTENNEALVAGYLK